MTTVTKTTAAPKTSAASKASPAPKAPAAAKDAIAMLKAEHGAVSALFADYEKADSRKKKKAIVAEICAELSVHVQVEEEIFYPPFKAALKDKVLVPEAVVEHGGIKELIAQLEGAEPDGEIYDAKVKVLSEYVEHHVKEEQTGMFAKAKTTALDLVELGARMATRKAELIAARG
jgi:hypothetical protein